MSMDVIVYKCRCRSFHASWHLCLRTLLVLYSADVTKFSEDKSVAKESEPPVPHPPRRIRSETGEGFCSTSPIQSLPF